MKLEHALDREDPPIPIAHWNRSLQYSKRLQNAFRNKCAIGIEGLLEGIDPANKGWQTYAWKAERVHGYTQARQGPSVSVTIQNLVGVADEVGKRARSFVLPERTKAIGNG
jgi:hypothetical protein